MILRILAVLFVGLITGCVSSSKYKDLDTKYQSESGLRQKGDAKIHEQEVLIADLQGRLGAASKNKAQLESSVTEMKQALSELSQRKAEADKRIREYADLTKKFQTLIDSGSLRVKIAGGRMVLELPSDVLFQSGSAKLSKEGKDRIAEVTQQLVGLTDRKFQIEGHTDNVPIHTERYDSNWDLAADRALNVVKHMVSAGMTPDRISAASFGEAKPIADNADVKTRAANRRIEIVVVTDLSNLPGMEELQKLSH